MLSQNFKIKNNLHVLGTGNSVVAGSLSVIGGITGTLNGNAATATAAAGAFTVPGTLTVGNSATSNIVMSDTVNGNRTIQCDTNNIGFLTQAGGLGSYCIDDGSWISVSNITAFSDERLKTNWRDLPIDFVTKLAEIKTGIYDRIDGDRLTQVGVSAQSLQRLLPDAVTIANDEMKTLGVVYGNAALVSAVELAKELVKLRSELAYMKVEILKLSN